MTELNKVSRLTIRLTPDQSRRVEAAAAIESRRQGEIVKPSTLVREVAMPKVDEIIAAAGRATDLAPEAAAA